MAGSSLPDAYEFAQAHKREQEEYAGVRTQAIAHLESIVSACARLKADTERYALAFLDQDDFVRAVRAAAKELIDHATHLNEI
jgi:hypothetical protein